MRDWERFVDERLARTSLPRETRDEIVAEIAAHLEEHEHELRTAGVPDPRIETMSQVADWRAFGRSIHRAKEGYVSIIRKLVIPGVVAWLMGLGALKLLVMLLVAPEACGPDTTCIRVTADGPVYLPWLLTLPFAGALSAILARGAGARPAQRLFVALVPALYLSSETLVMGLVDGFFWRIPLYWVLIPALLAALGAWPFLGGQRRVPAVQPMAPIHP